MGKKEEIRKSPLPTRFCTPETRTAGSTGPRAGSTGPAKFSANPVVPDKRAVLLPDKSFQPLRARTFRVQAVVPGFSSR